MKKAANVVLLLTHKRDSLIWLALLFSFVSHVISFLQFCISFEGLQVPERWFGQFTFLVACSMLAASLQFLLYKQWSALYICLASRFFILFFATYPMGNFIAVKTTLLTSLVFETMIYSTFPFSLIISTAFIAMSIIIRKSGSAWDRQVMWISFDNLLFVGFYPLIAMVLGGALKDAYMKASERRKLIEQIRSSSMNLVDTNIKLQEYIIKSEENTKLQERERISRELHDTIGYTLMNIIVLLKACMELAKTDTTTVFNLMAQGIDQAQKGLAETRAALRAIRSTKLMRQTLDTEVNRLVRAFKETHIEVTAKYSNVPSSFGQEIDYTICRMVQESITNAIRHGNATKISIHLSFDGDKAIVSISDNGGGSKEVEEGIGLTGMRERLINVNGGMALNNLDEGFQLYAWIPVKRSS